MKNNYYILITTLIFCNLSLGRGRIMQALFGPGPSAGSSCGPGGCGGGGVQMSPCGPGGCGGGVQTSPGGCGPGGCGGGFQVMPGGCGSGGGCGQGVPGTNMPALARGNVNGVDIRDDGFFIQNMQVKICDKADPNYTVAFDDKSVPPFRPGGTPNQNLIGMLMVGLPQGGYRELTSPERATILEAYADANQFAPEQRRLVSAVTQHYGNAGTGFPRINPNPNPNPGGNHTGTGPVAGGERPVAPGTQTPANPGQGPDLQPLPPKEDEVKPKEEAAKPVEPKADTEAKVMLQVKNAMDKLKTPVGSGEEPVREIKAHLQEMKCSTYEDGPKDDPKKACFVADNKNGAGQLTYHVYLMDPKADEKKCLEDHAKNKDKSKSKLDYWGEDKSRSYSNREWSVAGNKVKEKMVVQVASTDPAPLFNLKQTTNQFMGNSFEDVEVSCVAVDPNAELKALQKAAKDAAKATNKKVEVSKVGSDKDKYTLCIDGSCFPNKSELDIAKAITDIKPEPPKPLKAEIIPQIIPPVQNTTPPQTQPPVFPRRDEPVTPKQYHFRVGTCGVCKLAAPLQYPKKVSEVIQALKNKFPGAIVQEYEAKARGEINFGEVVVYDGSQATPVIPPVRIYNADLITRIQALPK